MSFNTFVTVMSIIIEHGATLQSRINRRRPRFKGYHCTRNKCQDNCYKRKTKNTVCVNKSKKKEKGN